MNRQICQALLASQYQLVKTQARFKPFFKLPPGSHWGMKKRDGDRVQRGDLLINQQGLRFYPGENVRIDASTCSLYALEAGSVVISVEKVSPRINSPIYESVGKDGVALFKEFFNILPEKQPNKFKLTGFI